MVQRLRFPPCLSGISDVENKRISYINGEGINKCSLAAGKVFMNIYVGNMSYSMSEDELRDAFATYGTVTSARLVMDRETGRPKGFGFVEMANDNEANAAIEALNGTEMGGRELKINEARPREERPRRSFGSGGGNGGGGGGNRRY